MVIKGKGEARVFTVSLMFPLYFRATNKHCDLAVIGEDGGGAAILTALLMLPI